WPRRLQCAAPRPPRRRVLPDPDGGGPQPPSRFGAPGRLPGRRVLVLRRAGREEVTTAESRSGTRRHAAVLHPRPAGDRGRHPRLAGAQTWRGADHRRNTIRARRSVPRVSLSINSASLTPPTLRRVGRFLAGFSFT